MGNCLEKHLSDDSDENSIIESTPDLANSQSSNLDMQHDRNENERTRRSSRQSRRHSSSRHMQINESNSSLSSGGNRHHRHHHHHHHNHNHNHDSSHRPFSHSLNFGYSGSSNSFMSSSLPTNGISTSGFANLMSNNNANNGSNSSSSQVYYLAPNVQRTADQLTEEEQIKLLKRMTLIQVIDF